MEQSVGQSSSLPGDRGHFHDEPNVRILYEASKIGSIQNLMSLIQKDPHILEKALISSWSADQSPLHVSVSYCHLEFTRFLLDHKPELVGEVDDTLQRTPLHLASSNGDMEMVHLLLEKNTGPCLFRDLNGLIPLHYALIRGDIEIAKALINARPQSLRTKLKNGQTLLHLCVIMNTNLEVIKFLIGLVFDDQDFLNTVDNYGNTILDLSLMLRQIELIRYLLSVPALKTAAGTSTMEMDATSASDVIKLRSSNNFEIKKTENIQREGEISCWKRLKKGLRYKGDWLQEVQNTMMLVATMIATMTFQSSINPPGGVWQWRPDTKIDTNLSMSILLAYPNSPSFILYIAFLVVNTISFLASTNVILLILSGFPLKNRICASVLKIIMCVAVVFLSLSFLNGMVGVNFDPINLNIFKVIGIGYIVLYLIVVLVILYYIIRFLICLVKFLIWTIKRIVLCFMCS